MAFITVVDNVASLLALSSTTTTESVETLGYYKPGDGGGGTYRADMTDTTSPGDGVLIQVANDGLRYKLVPVNGVVNLKQGGAKGDATGVSGVGADDTKRIQTVIDVVGQGTIYVPEGKFRTTSVLTVGAATKFIGEGYSITRISNATTPNPIAGGSWFYFDHLGRGFFLSTTDQGGLHRGISTLRNQPNALSQGWIPNDHDFDFFMNPSSVEWTFEDVMLLNPTRGFSLASRARLSNVRGQPFKTGVYMDFCTDTSRFESVHWWPYWADNANVEIYTSSNMEMYHFLRCDNPSLLNCFGIYAKYGVRISQGSSGTTSKLRVTSCDFDATAFGILVEVGANNATIYLENVLVQSQIDYQHFGVGLFVQANSCRVYASNFSGVFCYQGTIRVEGSANTVLIQNLESIDSDLGSVGYNGVNIAGGNLCTINGYYFANSVSTAAYIAGPGDIRVKCKTIQSTGRTDNNGVITYAHGLGFRPNGAIVQLISDACLTCVITDTSATSITMKFRNAPTAGPQANSDLQFYITPQDVFSA